MGADLEHGRESFGRQAWGDAHAWLSAADRETPLGIEDLERLAVAAYLVGRDSASADVWARAHRLCADEEDTPRAARCAFWLGFGLIAKGDLARAGGWFARARRVLGPDQSCVEPGYLDAADGIRSLFSGDAEAALSLFEQAAKIGEGFREPDLLTLAQLGRGQALIELGQITLGTACLDEAMVAVTQDEVSPIVAGLVYCAVIATCQRAFDLRRAQEWTAALSRWSAAQPDLVAYRGQCLVHRAEILRLHGSWRDAMEEAKRACERLADEPAVGDAYYQRAELHRLVGDFAEAEDGYHRANRWGRTPQPGLALLWLAQDRCDAADAAIRSALEDAPDRVSRPNLLAAQVETALAVADVGAARTAADELASLADDLDAPYLHALAASAQGVVFHAEGAAGEAVAQLRRAWRAWQELEAPYEAGRVRVLLAGALREVGDHDTADMELDAARWIFDRLGAAPDLARIEAMPGTAPSGDAGGLSRRELQVVVLVARGKTNRQIAAELVISEKTVARHMSNIFTKLDVSSRAAATAYAYEHGLV
jgi:ATP/maltotriose-dependent transcriptional regulator MalT